MANLTSTIDKVKLFSYGAMITRIATVELIDNEIPTHIEITGLPLTIDNSKVRARIEGEGNLAVVTDIRIGMSLPDMTENCNSSLAEEIHQAEIEVKKLIQLKHCIQYEHEQLNILKIPERPQGEEGKPSPPSPLTGRLALARFKESEKKRLMDENFAISEDLHQAQENLADLRQKQQLASTAVNIEPDKLRKSIIVSLNYEGEKQNFGSQQLILEYFISHARWTPTYVCRLDSQTNSVTVEIRALIAQKTDEDWLGVKLELSTANPQTWCELPQLNTLRIGRKQPPISPVKGWRELSLDSEILFADFDGGKPNLVTSSEKNNYFDKTMTLSEKLKYEQLSDIVEEGDFSETTTQTDLIRAKKSIPLSYTPEISTNFVKERSLDLQGAVDKPKSPPNPLSSMLDSVSSMAGGFIEKRQEYKTTTKVKQDLEIGQTDNYYNYEKINLAYHLMRLAEANNKTKRGKLYLEEETEFYVESLLFSQQFIIEKKATIKQTIRAILNNIQQNSINIPIQGIDVRKIAGSFDYVYQSDGRIDLQSDGQYHSVSITKKSTNFDVNYVVVPSQDLNVFGIAKFKNPFNSPLLNSPCDVYLDGEFILTSELPTIPAYGKVPLGFGVQQQIKVSRNTKYQETQSVIRLGIFNEFKHQINIEVINLMPQNINLEIRERVPIPDPDNKIDIEIGEVSPMWEKYEQKEENQIIKGGYRWLINLEKNEKKTLLANYTITTFANQEIVGGNRRE